MRLGVDIRCLQDRWRTGVGEYVWQTLKVLSTDPSLHLRGFANAAGRIDLPPGLERVVEIHRSRVPNKFMNLKQFWRLGQPIDELARARSEPLDIFWLPNPGFAFLSGRRPAVLTVHDLAFMHFPELFPHRGRLWYFPAVKRLLTQGLPPRSLVAAVSQHTADDVAHCFPVLRERIRVVPPGLDARYLEAPTAEACGQVRQRYGLPAQYLLSLGTVEPRKNYALLVAAYEEIVRQNKNYPYDLVIAGAWGWRTASLRRLLARLTSRGRIHFIGYVPDEDKPALYAQAKLFLYPSLYEGIGLPPLEAMAAGVPVVASQSSSLPEVVGESGILLSPYQPEVWAHTISWLSGDSMAQQQLVERGRARAKLFSWVNTATAYQTLFRELTT